MEEAGVVRKPIVISLEQGRVYAMGPMRAIFKADSKESASRHSVSEWSLDPRTRGPGVHAHAEGHVFYVIAGTMSVRVNDDWSHVTKGPWVVIQEERLTPLRIRDRAPSGFISFNSPGGFEARMTAIESLLAVEDL
jgi:hypothetical protein